MTGDIHQKFAGECHYLSFLYHLVCDPALRTCPSHFNLKTLICSTKLKVMVTARASWTSLTCILLAPLIWRITPGGWLTARSHIHAHVRMEQTAAFYRCNLRSTVYRYFLRLERALACIILRKFVRSCLLSRSFA